MTAVQIHCIELLSYKLSYICQACISNTHLRNVTTILLITTLLFYTFPFYVTQASYSINKKYIAEKLCVNREKPKMHCEGKCFLAKQLKQQGEEQAPLVKHEKLQLDSFCLPGIFELIHIDLPIRKAYLITNDIRKPSQPRAVFHPPSFC